MKNLLIKIWQGEVNLKSARRAITIISILVPIVGIGSFFYKVFNVWDKDNFLYGTVYYDSFFTINLAVGSFILFLSLIVLGLSTRKHAHLIKFHSIYIIFQAIPLIFYVFICVIFAMVFNFQTEPYDPYEENSPEGIFKKITKKNIPKGARIVFSTSPESRHPITIVLDASEMDLTKWINETEFFLNKEYWSGTQEGVWINGEFHKDSVKRQTRKMRLVVDPSRDFYPYLIEIESESKSKKDFYYYLSESQNRSILKCESRSKEKPEDKYFLKICNAINSNQEIWHLSTSMGQRCCRLQMYAFKKEKIILALGTGW